MGAWIETNLDIEGKPICIVAPCVGAWIETTFTPLSAIKTLSRTLRGCVD